MTLTCGPPLDGTRSAVVRPQCYDACGEIIMHHARCTWVARVNCGIVVRAGIFIVRQQIIIIASV